jgi:S-methylmethionine-dependent homocysteine/selenocysteine methylase
VTSADDRTVKPYDFNVDELWEYLERIFEERVVILDGGMGTELQTYRLEED